MAEQVKTNTFEFEDVRILEPNENELVHECRIQPKLFLTWALKLKAARYKWERAKAKLRLTDAELSEKIRANAPKYGLPDSVTAQERVIPNKILQHKEHRKAERIMLARKNDVEVLEAMVDTLDHRKAMIEGMIKLHGQSYFATPRANGEEQAALAVQTKRNVRGRNK